MAAAEICEALDIGASTWRRWRSNDSIPRAAELALRFLNGDLVGWPGFRLEGEWIRGPSGFRVHREVVGNIGYYSYLQRCLGYASEWPPGAPKNPADITIIDERRLYQLRKIGLLGHNEPG